MFGSGGSSYVSPECTGLELYIPWFSPVVRIDVVQCLESILHT